ncbi:MAG TPA: universal stress protein [Gaiellaceae bacterium]|nr:universal stress protein [Gaiellaceae bacterium]HUJ54940.1 universal stress protein [Gaiellaceae bacterium]
MSDTRPIMLATDGSPSAAGAQREALELARLLDAPLLAVTVEHTVLPAVGYSAYGFSQVVAELTEAERKRAEQTAKAVGAAADQVDVRCDTVVAEGAVADQLCLIAKKRDARMIVVGSHGWGAGKRLLFGSVSAALLHQAPCPVLVVRGEAPELVEHPAAA